MERKKIKVVILCGGRGTRFREKTVSVPKPLIKIHNRPLLWHIMKIYKAQGFFSFILSGGYKFGHLKEFAKKYKNEFEITVENTGADTDTGGRIFLLRKYLRNEQFMCTYGDGLANIDLNKLLKFHEKYSKIATITSVRPYNQFGVLKMKNGLVKTFVEKPQLKDWINGGFFVFEKEIFNYLSKTSRLETTPFEKLAFDGQMAAYRHKDFWVSLDTFKDYQLIKDLWYNGLAKWKIW